MDRIEFDNESSPSDLQRNADKQSIQSLVHSCQCSDANCLLPLYRMIKVYLEHKKICKVKTKCDTCQKIYVLYFYHAKECKIEECPFPFCTEIKNKLKQRRYESLLKYLWIILLFQWVYLGYYKGTNYYGVVCQLWLLTLWHQMQHHQIYQLFNGDPPVTVWVNPLFHHLLRLWLIFNELPISSTQTQKRFQ